MSSLTRVLITGGTGFVGARLAKRFTRPTILSRNAEKAKAQLGDVDARAWDATAAIAPGAFDGVDVVFHLAGDSVADGRWTEEKRARIRDSRVVGTRRVVEGMAAAKNGPRVLVAASAVGYYGDRGDTVLAEDAAPGADFLAEVCVAWEAEAMRAQEHGVRVVTARIGIVLGDSGGALSKMLPPFRLGLGGPLGSGKQYMPWIHVDDVVGLLEHAFTNDAVAGAMNTTAPEPVTNRDFTRALGRALHRPAFLPVPKLALEIALGDFASAILGSQRAVPTVALRTGYRFAHSDLDVALRQVVGG